MSKAKPTVQKFMTTGVESIHAGKTLKDAIDLMEVKGIRHLPVTLEDKVIGIISDRDIKLALSIIGIDPAKTVIQDACKDRVYAVSPDVDLDLVASTMAEKHYGSAVVMQNDKLVGILTLVDICRALSTVINERHH